MRTVLDFGARGDGESDDTRALQRTLDLGGLVVLPAGNYSSGTLFIRSNTTLRLEAGAVLRGRPDLALFPGIPAVRDSRLGRIPWRAFLSAEGAEHIVLEGPGKLAPGGSHPVFQNGIGDSPERPFGLHFVNCRGVTVRDIGMEGSAFWMQRYFCCEDVAISNVRVYNHCNLNNDGMDIDGCRRVRITGCEIDASDDALVIKSESTVPSEDIEVSGCTLRSHASAIKLGTGSVGGFRRITIGGCTVGPSTAPEVHHPFKVRGGLCGIDLGCVDRGVMEDITVHDITITGVQSPIFVRLGDRGPVPWADAQPACGQIRNVTIRNIRADGAGPIASSITGYPGALLENVTLENIRIEAARSAFVGNVDGLPTPKWLNPLIHGSADPEDREKILSHDVPENIGEYPVNRLFGCPLPVYGLYIRHVLGLRVDGLHLRMRADDDRPALLIEDAPDACVRNLDLVSRGPRAIIRR
jgi:polygalacturonase